MTDDTSYSILIDNSERSQFNTYDKIQPRRLKTWVKDETVTECYLCFRPFTLFLRKHHCRNCGHVFCYKCSDFLASIPDTVRHLPKYLNQTDHMRDNFIDWYKWLSNKPHTKKERVCETCYYKLQQLIKMRALINIFEKVDLNVFEFRKLACVCKLWRQLANYYLSQFREIQYYLPNHKFSKLDKKLLWSNRRLIIGHNKYLIQLLNSIDYEDYNITYQLREISTLLKHNKNDTTCKQMLCSRSCKTLITPEEALTLLNPNIKSKFIRKYAMHFISKAPVKKVICFLPFLINRMACETIENSIIGKYLIALCHDTKDISMANQIYWQLKVSSESEMRSGLYKYFIQKMEKELPHEMMDKIQKVIDMKHTLEKVSDMKDRGTFLENTIRETVIPTNPNISVMGIDKEHFQIIDSATKPMVLPFMRVTDDDTRKLYKVLYKPDDVRKDLIIMSLIRLMDQILKDEENLDLHILTYNVLPVSSEAGFVDMVANCETVYKIREKLNYSILNYIIDKNPDENADKLRYRFMKSCAAYCVITYLLGIGDRHLSNIMMTNEGYLFHIDFGFVLGYDPKLIREVSMRIFPDMVDALGGVNSQYYNEFKRLCTQTFNCWRKHINLFVNFLTLFADIRPKMYTNLMISPEFSQEKIIKEILGRFIPGQNCNQAELTLYNCIDSSTQAYHHTVTDFFHHHQQENSLHSIIYNTYNSTRGLMSEVYRYLNSNSPPMLGEK